MRTVTDEGRTVIFSSHLLDEVDRVSDHLAMLHHGTLRFCAPLEDIKSRHRRLSLHFERPQPEPPNVPGAGRRHGRLRERSRWSPGNVGKGAARRQPVCENGDPIRIFTGAARGVDVSCVMAQDVVGYRDGSFLKLEVALRSDRTHAAPILLPVPGETPNQWAFLRGPKPSSIVEKDDRLQQLEAFEGTA